MFARVEDSMSRHLSKRDSLTTGGAKTIRRYRTKSSSHQTDERDCHCNMKKMNGLIYLPENSSTSAA